MANRYNPIATTSSNRYTPTTTESKVTFDLTPVKTTTTNKSVTPAPLAPGPRATTPVQGETISQNRTPVEDSLFTKVAKTLLPKAAEDYFGLNEPAETKRITPMEAQRAAEEVKKTEVFQKATKDVPLFAAGKPGYESPAAKKTKELLNHPAVAPVLKEIGRRTSTTGVMSMIESVGPKTFTQAYEANKAIQAGDPSKLNQFIYQLGDSAPQTLVGVALNFIPYAGKPLATTYWIALSANEQIENKGKVTSLGNIGIDVALDRVLGKTIESLFKKPAKTLLASLTKTFTAEGGTEVSQDLLKMGNDYRNAKTETEKQAILQAGKDYFTSGQILMTAGVGGLTGAGIGAGTHVINKNEPQVAQALSEAADKNLGIAEAIENTPVGLSIKSTVPDIQGTSNLDEIKMWEESARKQIEDISKGEVKVIKSSTSNRWLYDIGNGQLMSSPFSTKENTINFANQERVKALDYLKNDYVRENTKTLDQTANVQPSATIDTTKTIGELNDEYQATQPGYKKVSNFFDTMVKNGTMLEEDATILKTLLKGTNDSFLNDKKYFENARYKTKFGLHTIDRARPGGGTIQIKKGLASTDPEIGGGGRVFVHEFYHNGYWTILNNEERAIVNEVYNSMRKTERQALFAGTSHNVSHHISNVKEFFAQSGSDYVYEHKVPAEQMEPLLKKVSRVFFDRIKNLVFRREEKSVKRLQPLFEKILAGDRSTPLSEFAANEPISFKQQLQAMIDNLAPEVKKQQVAAQTKEVPVETLAPTMEGSAIDASETILDNATQSLPPDIVSTIDPLEKIVAGDTRTPLKERVGIIDYLRTPWKVFDKMGIRPSFQSLLKGYENYVAELPGNIDKITEWSKRVPQESNERIFRYLDGENITLTPEEAQVASEIKIWLSEWADRLGMAPDARISDYITHIFPIGKGGEIPEEIAVIINKKMPGSIYNPFLLQRQGAEGYIKNTWLALDAYVKRATRKVNMDPALAEMKEASAKLTDVSQINYINNYLNSVNMRPTELDNLIDNTLKKNFGYLFGARPTATWTRALRQMVSRAKIGGSIISFAKNLTQGVNTFAELGSFYTTKGYIDLVKFGGKELRDNGVLVAPFIEDRTYSAVKKVMEKFDTVLFVNMNASELVNRGAAYYGAKAKFLANKVTPKEFREALGREKPENYTPTLQDAVDYGKFVAAKTQFLFGPIHTPVALSSDIARMVAQFQTFGLKQTEFVGHMLGDREWRKLLRYLMSTFFLFSIIGRAFGMKWSDAFKPLRWGYPPIAQFFVDLYEKGWLGEDKYGNKIKKVPAVAKTIFTNIVPGGAQMERTFQGLSAVNAGKDTTASGKFKFKVDQSAPNYIRGALFGKYNLPENVEYYKKQEEKKKKKSSPSGSNRYNPI